MKNRKRMIFDLPEHIQMAIRLRAIKDQCTTTEVVRTAIETIFPEDVEQAEKALEERAT